MLVDGLWEAGAEAIAINDQRINALGGIRNTSRAIHVNGRPVNAPYVVSAIGDPRTCRPDCSRPARDRSGSRSSAAWDSSTRLRMWTTCACRLRRRATCVV